MFSPWIFVVPCMHWQQTLPSSWYTLSTNPLKWYVFVDHKSSWIHISADCNRSEQVQEATFPINCQPVDWCNWCSPWSSAGEAGLSEQKQAECLTRGLCCGVIMSHCWFFKTCIALVVLRGKNEHRIFKDMGLGKDLEMAQFMRVWTETKLEN